MRKDCKYADSCMLRLVSAEFAKNAGIEIRETPCCIECRYFEPRESETRSEIFNM
jgi:hypothetical protein